MLNVVPKPESETEILDGLCPSNQMLIFRAKTELIGMDYAVL